MTATKELLEAARKVAFFDGATPENLERLRGAICEVDARERDKPWDDDEGDERPPLTVTTERTNMDTWQVFAAAALTALLAREQQEFLPKGSDEDINGIAEDAALLADALYEQWKQRVKRNLEGR